MTTKQINGSLFLLYESRKVDHFEDAFLIEREDLPASHVTLPKDIP